MKDIKVLFMGTPEISVKVLDNLNKYTNIVGVITKKDAYVGRKKILTPCPVKEYAINNNLNVYSPDSINDVYNFIVECKPDIIITCAYGKILTKEILDYPRLGCINIHASLLPKYRGASPIQSAIMNGDSITGITLMYMEEGLDTGDIIKQDSIKIDTLDNYETLTNKLSDLASKMIIDELPSIINGTNNRIKQDEGNASYVGLIKRSDEHLDYNTNAINIYNKVRAFYPSSLANFILDDLEYKLVSCEIVDVSGKSGYIVLEDKETFTIMAKDKGVRVLKIKPPGKGIMSVKDFKNGYKSSLVGKEIK